MELAEGELPPVDFTVLQWNVLARPYTSYNWGGGRPAPHDSVQGHCNTEATESAAQTAARYSLSAAGLLEQAPDAAMLQEVEPAYFDSAVNPGAGKLLEQYVAYSCFGGAASDQPGVVVLLREGGALSKAPGMDPVLVQGDRATGGPSKGSILVPVVPVGDGGGGGAGGGGGGAPVVWIGSIHLTPPKFNPEKARHHLERTLAAIQPPCECAGASVLLAGDFNASGAEVDTLLADPVLGEHMLNLQLQRIPLGDGVMTGLSADFSSQEAIDHTLVSGGLLASTTTNGADALSVDVEKVPVSPYATSEGRAPAEVLGASDHVWIKIRVQAGTSGSL